MTNLCPHCFEETELKRRIEEIRPHVSTGRCSYHPRYKGVPIEHVAQVIDEVFRSTYAQGSFNAHSGEQYGDDLPVLIHAIARPVNDAIIEAIIDQLIEDDPAMPQDGDEPFYDRDQNYTAYEPDDYHHSLLWDSFCESVVHAQRFFNTKAKDLIAELFDEIQFQRDNEKNSPVYQIVPGDPESRFVRARVIDNSEGREKAREQPAERLGPPPKRLRKAGRMNAAGVGAFYGAMDLEACIAELRPAVGSHVMAATFQLIRPIHVLDTTRFTAPIKPMSRFSKKYLKRVQQWKFMKSFMEEIAKPVLPTDEYLDYIPTQAVAEYLLHHHMVKHRSADTRIEGIIYKSAQRPGGRNIVLLGDAASVRNPEHQQPKRKTKSIQTPDIFDDLFGSFMKEEVQDIALEVIQDSVKEYRIGGADYQAAEVVSYDFDPDGEMF